METNARYLTIGCFALAAIVACLGFVFWLNRSGGLGQQDVYQVRFGNQVSGLQTGGAVLFDGMRVGSVSRLELDPQDPRHVVANPQGGDRHAGATGHGRRYRQPGPDGYRRSVAGRRQPGRAASSR